MNDFHDALRHEAHKHGEAVAAALAADAVVASSVRGIVRGRRRRATAQAGAGVLGATAIGLAAWLAVPFLGAGETEPASAGDPSSGPAPSGDHTYRAFVVPPPEPGCSPLADQLAAGLPSTQSVEFPVEVPGVTQPLTGELWGAEPVLVLPPGEEPWYLGLDAWVVAADVSDGIPDPHLTWTSLSVGGWALSPGGDDSLRDPECAYNQPIPDLEGAVYLVIEGVDPDALEQAAPGIEWAYEAAELHTWVYLGEAN
ncbi:MAG: hypothetical protein ACK4MD_09770 [Demequina sp.]